MPNPHLVEATTEAARRFLDGLGADQREAATAAFDDGETRFDWHYIPRARPGLCLADMTAAQQKSAYELLRTGLTESSYATACLVMALEDVLDSKESGRGPRRGKQRDWGRHRAEYHTIVFGEPGASTWAWRFEGHHVSVTVTVVDSDVAFTPHFLGANPMAVPGSYRLFTPEQDVATRLLIVMTDSERAEACASDVAPDDILTTNARDVADLLPADEGVVIGDLGDPARSIARQLVMEYATRVPGGDFGTADAERLRFVFAGPYNPTNLEVSPPYYRLQGADVLIEYDNTQDGGNHVHTVVRDPDGDFGDDLLRRHRATAHP